MFSSVDFQKLFTSLYNINFSIASLKKLPTDFENACQNPPHNSLLSDWSIFSSVDPSLAAGKIDKNQPVTGGFQHDFTGMHFRCQNRRFRVFEEIYRKK
jgi:hypothetical protein